MADDATLSDSALLAVLQTTQLDHERRIAEIAAQSEKNRELFEQRFEAVRDAMSARDDRIYTRIGEVEHKIEKNRETTENKIDASRTENKKDTDGLRNWIMGLVAAVIVQIAGGLVYVFVIRGIH